VIVTKNKRAKRSLITMKCSKSYWKLELQMIEVCKIRIIFKRKYQSDRQRLRRRKKRRSKEISIFDRSEGMKKKRLIVKNKWSRTWKKPKDLILITYHQCCIIWRLITRQQRLVSWTKINTKGMIWIYVIAVPKS